MTKLKKTEEITLPSDTVKNFLKFIPPYFRKSNIQVLSEIFLMNIQPLFDVVEFFKDNYNINAQGYLLDLFGKDFSVFRKIGENDYDYRTRITEKIILTRFCGTKKELLDIVDYLFKPRYRNVIDYYKNIAFTVILDGITNLNGLKSLRKVRPIETDNNIVFTVYRDSHGFFLGVQSVSEVLVDIIIDNDTEELYNIDILRVNNSDTEILVVGQDSSVFDRLTESRLGVQDNEDGDILIEGNRLFIQYEEERY